MKQNKFQVDLQPIGRRIEVYEGETVLDAAREAGVGIISICGGDGWCESCLVQVIKGTANPVTDLEISMLSDSQEASGYRLACQLAPASDLRVNIPPGSLTTPQRLQIEGQEISIKVNPIIKFIDITISPPDIEDLRSDEVRLIDTLHDEGYQSTFLSHAIQTSFSESLRELEWETRVIIRDNEIIDILPKNSPIFGVAVDIGTTKLAIYLINLENGEIIQKVGRMNPQIAYGEDVVSRIAFANKDPKGRGKLQKILVKELDEGIDEIAGYAGIKTESIMDVVIVGNTAIHHLFAGLPVWQLVMAPYVPSISLALDIQSKGFGLNISPGAYIHLLPNIAGYVGADHTAAILSTELWKAKENSMVIDIGTNTEISLNVDGKIYSCSCASGPAFEGAHIKDGMRAAPGAIERIQILDEEIKLFTIGDELPVGICGSGIIDAVAEMRRANIINEKGALIEGALNVQKGSNGKLEFKLADISNSEESREITLSRKDVNEIQMAKGAIRAGIEVLIMEAGIKPIDVKKIYIAGAFGTYINVKNAISLGMFPEIPLDRFDQIGNAAGMGAVQALLSQDSRRVIQKVVRNINYVELTTRPDFQKEFMKGLYL